MDKIKVHILHTGSVIVPEAVQYFKNGKNMDKMVELPVSAYLVEHPKGLILIDTGWHSDNVDKGLYKLFKAKVKREEIIDKQIEGLGYKTSDIDYILISHMDIDHIGGLRMVKDAKKIMTSKEEWERANSGDKRYFTYEWDGVNVETFELEKTGKGPKGKSFDLFGDGTVEMIFVGGHSAGLCSTIIKSPKNDKYVLLTSDSAYTSKSWEENLTPTFVVSRDDAEKGLEWIRENLKNPNCIAIIPNHDNAVKPQVIEL